MVVRDGSLRRSYESNCKALQESWGFFVERKESSIPNCGRGVFLAGGSAPAGKLVCLYPGTIYRPGDAILLQSLGNSFILRCLDGLLIDGFDGGISAAIYRSCVARDRFHPYCHAADLSWLTSFPEVPFNVGQYVNNGGEGASNVAYRELTVQPGRNFPIDLVHFLPNIPFVAASAASSGGDCAGPQSSSSSLSSSTSSQQVQQPGGYLPSRRLVALVTTRDVDPGEELLSSYFTVVTS